MAKVLKFDMKEDNKSRDLSKKAHSVAVLIKQAGFPIRMQIPANKREIVKLFQKKPEPEYFVFEFPKVDETKLGEITDFITIHTKALVIDSRDFMYPNKQEVTRVLVDLSRVTA